MIENKSLEEFSKGFNKKLPGMHPVSAQAELTYRCNLDCVHCYCSGTTPPRELSTAEWKTIFDDLHKAGTIWLTMTGGEPLLREDFFDLYEYARSKGFLVSIFTNGILFDDAAIACLIEHPPYSVEISLNGITGDTYETIARVDGSFSAAMKNIAKLAKAGIPLVLKAVGLKQNKDEILRIKAYARDLLGDKKFKFDSFIVPRLDGNLAPCAHRLSPDVIAAIEERDPDMIEQREKEFGKHRVWGRDPVYKYRCNAWFKNVYISPDGRLHFCHISDKYTSDLTQTPFLIAFYHVFPEILNERHGHPTVCMVCAFREFCHICPARAMLEVGNEEGPVPYYCALAKARKARAQKSNPDIL